MRKPRELTVEGGIWILCQDIISQIEEGRDLDHLRLPGSFEQWIQHRIEEKPEAFLKLIVKLRQALQTLESDFRDWAKK